MLFFTIISVSLFLVCSSNAEEKSISLPDRASLYPKDLSINMRVRVNTARENNVQGVIRFIGHTSFHPGIWIGVALSVPYGKNDGSINGRRYFDCAPEHGLFVKEEGVEVVQTGDDGVIDRDKDSQSTTSQESPSMSNSEVAAMSNSEVAEKRGKVTGLLKVKLAQMMELLNYQLEIVVALEEEDVKKSSNSERAAELRQEILSITNQEQNLIDSFKQHLNQCR
jgi:hypothetical protein